MEAKEYLSQGFILRRLIKAKESRIADLRDMISAPSSPRTGTGWAQLRPDKGQELIAQLIDATNECETDLTRLIRLQQEIMRTIDAAAKNSRRVILIERYVFCHRWHHVADNTGYSQAAVYKLHRKGLREVQRFLDGVFRS